MSIANRAKGVSPSLTLAITAKSKKMKEDGIDVISFSAGEPDFNTPDYIIEAAKVALDKGMTKYTPSSGTLNLRKAICEKLKKDNNLDYSPNQIVVSNGAKHSLYNAMQAIVNPGDEVIIPAPYWLTYPELVKLSDGIPVAVNTCEKNGFKLTAEELEQAITPKTKALIFNSPSNPTGSVYSKAEITALAKVIEKAGIYVISDEIYEKLVYDGAQHYSIAECSPKLYEKTVIVNGVSKTYAMTGWRIGYTASNKEIANAIDNMQSHTTSNANSIAQYATQVALSSEKGNEFLRVMQDAFTKRRQFMLERIKAMSIVSCVEPHGAFYVMMKVSGLFNKAIDGKVMKTAQDVAELMLDKVNVAVIPGESFGADEYIRLSYAISEKDIKTGLDSIEKFVALAK